MCNKKDLVVTKTVRASTEMVAELMKEIPNLKIIHYIRDPRPVALSRQVHASLRGIFAENGKDSLVNSAHLYCQDVERDLRNFEHLVSSHPDNYKRVFFEELALHPHTTSAGIYNFLGYHVPLETVRWLEDNTRKSSKFQTTRKSSAVVSGWRKKMDNATLQSINRRCAGLYHYLSTEQIGSTDLWPDTFLI